MDLKMDPIWTHSFWEPFLEPFGDHLFLALPLPKELQKGPKSTFSGLRVNVKSHLATALSQNSVLNDSKDGNAAGREGGGSGLAGKAVKAAPMTK